LICRRDLRLLSISSWMFDSDEAARTVADSASLRGTLRLRPEDTRLELPRSWLGTARGCSAGFLLAGGDRSFSSGLLRLTEAGDEPWSEVGIELWSKKTLSILGNGRRGEEGDPGCRGPCICCEGGERSVSEFKTGGRLEARSWLSSSRILLRSLSARANQSEAPICDRATHGGSGRGSGSCSCLPAAP
jgi:hypothetical protein